MGETNFLSGKIAGVDGATATVETPVATFAATIGGNGWQPKAGEACTLSIRPEAWQLSTRAAAQNCIAGRIHDRMYLGEMAQYQFAAGPQTLKIYELNPRFVELSPEREVFATAATEDVVALPV
jgi:ABC-type Fe3+/spermidine/putrescine transport system ATPase subunit